VLIDLDHALTAADARARLVSQGFAVLTPPALAQLAGHPLAELAALAPFWDDLPHDRYLRDLGRYRSRRHGCAVVHVEGHDAQLTEVPHRPHWQSTAYNALHGGLERWFEPIDRRMAEAGVWRARRATGAGTSRLIRFASTPRRASAARRRRVRIVTGSTSSR
jgi:hypothetical protein